MKYYIANDLGCVFRRSNNSTIRELEFAPLLKDNTFNTEDFGLVEPDLVGEETVIFNNQEMTLYKVWELVEGLL